MAQTIPHNLDSPDDFGGGSPDADKLVDSHNAETETPIKGINDNGEEGNGGPHEALKVIQKQKTYNLCCPKCHRDITQTARLIKEGEPNPYNKQSFILLVPLPSPSLFSSFGCSWEGPIPSLFTGLGEKLKKLPWLSSTSLWFLLGAVLLFLSVIVLSSPSPLPLPEPISPSPAHLHEKIRWLIHFMSIKYLPVLSLLFLAILTLPWRSIISFWLPATDPDHVVTPDTPLIPPSLHEETRIVDLRKNPLPRELDIMKSIVYGGLIESITSLGVVSSAAASGASTLNVLSLGLANLFSGLFLIIHNLYGLITRENSDLNTEHPYQKLLGDKTKFKLHCFVVVVSFIFFGVIPPLFYGLSFKQTDKGHYKAAVVLVASLVCVSFLSFAKAYAFQMDKPKTVAEYTGMAIGASALSFIASHIVADLFEKYGLHELASDYRKG